MDTASHSIAPRGPCSFDAPPGAFDLRAAALQAAVPAGHAPYAWRHAAIRGGDA